MSNTPGFQPIQQYKAPAQTQNDKLFFQPAGTTVLGGQSPQEFLTAGNPTPDMITNRTVKVDGAYTRDQMGQMGEALSGQIGTVNGNLTTGFTGLNQNLATGLTGVNNNLQTGFTGLNNNLGEVNKNVTAVGNGVTSVGNAVTEGNKANAAGFTGLNSVLATQGTNMDKIGSNLTNYFTQLNAGQDAAKAQLGTLNTGFNDFRSDYDKDTTRQDQTGTQILNGMQGGFQQVNDRIASTANATQAGLQNLSAPQKQGAQNLMANVAGTGFANRPTAQASGGTTTQGAQGQVNPAMVQGVNAIRSVLATQGGALDPAMANSFNEIANSFDQGGNLIPQSQGMNGFSIVRQLDPQGNLVTAQRDGQGQVLSQTMINMNASLMAANSLAR